MQIKYISYSSPTRVSPWHKIGAAIGAVALGVTALMFSAVLLPIILLIVVIGGAYLWWRTREVRKQFRDMQAQMEQMQGFARQTAKPQSEAFQGEVYEGEIIEGEAVRVDERRPL